MTRLDEAHRRANTEPCPRCGRNISRRSDGQQRAHRTEDSPASPRCTGGGTLTYLMERE